MTRGDSRAHRLDARQRALPAALRREGHALHCDPAIHGVLTMDSPVSEVTGVACAAQDPLDVPIIIDGRAVSEGAKVI